MRHHVSLIGIDGLNPYIVGKYLFSSLRNSLKMRLKSIIPPITAPAWVSIATGLDPGKTGIIDFLNPTDANRRILRPVSSRVYKGISVWDYASLAGYRVCVIDYPMLYPPYPVNGIIIPGFLSPQWESYPKTLINGLQAKLGPHWDHIYFAIERKYNNVVFFLEELLESLERKIKWSLYMLYKEDCELFVDVISHTDWLFHRCWHILDPNHKVAAKNPELSSEMHNSEAKALIDYFFATISDYISSVEETSYNTIVVSDHGFGPLKYTINSAKLLKAFELTRFNLLNPFTRPHGIINRISWLVFPRFFEKTPFEFSITSYDVIDYNNSIVYMLPHDELIFALYIDNKYYNKRSRIITYLKNKAELLSHGLGVPLKLIDLHDFYYGPKTKILPDVIIIIGDHSSYFEFKPYSNYLLKNACKRRYTGIHKVEGVFIAKGKNFRRSLQKDFSLEMNLLDVAPTVLALLGLPVPRYISGAPRSDLLQGEKPGLDTTGIIRLKAHYAKQLMKFLNPDI